MKKLFAILFVAVIALCANSVNAQTGKDSKTTTPTKLAKGEVLKRGEALGDSKKIKLADALKNPQKYNGQKVIIEGVIEKSCTAMGCWMEIAPKAGAASRVRADTAHKFFIPLDAQGMKIKAEGVLAVKTLSKEEADHFEEEGAKLKRNADGTVTELSFAAVGVELRK